MKKEAVGCDALWSTKHHHHHQSLFKVSLTLHWDVVYECDDFDDTGRVSFVRRVGIGGVQIGDAQTFAAFGGVIIRKRRRDGSRDEEHGA